MKAILNKTLKQGVTFEFQQAGGIKTSNSLIQRQSAYNVPETDMKHFLKERLNLDLPQIKNNPQIDKIKKRIQAFAKQYGQKTQKTTSIFMNYLQTVRQAGVNYLKNKDFLKSASYFAQCLRFVDPKYDEIFYQKFLIVKIDAINKLMYCIFELQSLRNRDYFLQDKELKKIDRYANAEQILTQFLDELHQFQKIQSLKKSQNCMLQVNYFYLGRLRKKNSNKSKAIEAFKQALQMIQIKLNSKSPTKKEQVKSFLQNLRVKTLYKLSKCYRQQKNIQKNIQMQKFYQKEALSQAKDINNSKLQCYILKKIIFYDSKQKFNQRLTKLDGKRRIQQEIIKLIEQSRQNQIKSLYNIYKFQPETQ